MMPYINLLMAFQASIGPHDGATILVASHTCYRMRRDCVPSVELRRRLCLTRIPALLVQRRLRWFGELIRTLSYPHRLARGADELEAS